MDEIFEYPNCTPVQAQAIPPAMRGTDVMARARTGTGKTLGFLIPGIERLAGPARGAPVRGVSVLVVSPARELAMQTHKDAVKLLQFRHGMRAECVIGGTNMKSEARRMRDQGVDVLVATPGRLLDHAENTPGMREALGRVQVLVLDECDQLLDRGFLKEIRRILALMPRTQDRQTLLFSATISKTIQDVAKVALKPDHVFVNTVKESGAPTHAAVSQEVIAAQPHALAHTLWRVLAHHAAKEPHFKVILFTATARMAQFLSSLLRRAGLPGGAAAVVDIHSRKSQSARERASKTFLAASRGFLVSSDVSARGMDYPDVTLVCQLGLTTREQYIHRLGRTARAGRAGDGVLVLLDAEAGPMMRELKGLAIKPAGPGSTIAGGEAAGIRARAVVGCPAPVVPEGRSTEVPQMQAALDAVGTDRDLNKDARLAYGAWLGFYNSNMRRMGWKPEALVRECNRLFAEPGGLGLLEVPALEAKTLGKMGLRGTPGLKEAPRAGGGQARGGAGGGRGRGGGGRGRGRGRGRR